MLLAPVCRGRSKTGRGYVAAVCGLTAYKRNGSEEVEHSGLGGKRTNRAKSVTIMVLYIDFYGVSMARTSSIWYDCVRWN